jgi:hypothetical protein
MSISSKPYRPDPEKGCCEFHVFGSGACTCSASNGFIRGLNGIPESVMDNPFSGPSNAISRDGIEDWRWRNVVRVMDDGIRAAAPLWRRLHGSGI